MRTNINTRYKGFINRRDKLSDADIVVIDGQISKDYVYMRPTCYGIEMVAKLKFRIPYYEIKGYLALNNAEKTVVVRQMGYHAGYHFFDHKTGMEQDTLIDYLDRILDERRLQRRSRSRTPVRGYIELQGNLANYDPKGIVGDLPRFYLDSVPVRKGSRPNSRTSIRRSISQICSLQD